MTDQNPRPAQSDGHPKIGKPKSQKGNSPYMEVEKNLRLPFFFCACHLIRPKKEISQHFLKILEKPPNIEVLRLGKNFFLFFFFHMSNFKLFIISRIMSHGNAERIELDSF
jgi:hypothetical protein